jgi:hypothetical protein
MVAYYFGGGGDLWAEIQWTAWLFDGGVPLMLAYPAAILIMIRYAVRVAIESRSRTTAAWAAVVAGYDLGALALTFSYQAFMSSAGIEFWLLNATLVQAAAQNMASDATVVPANDPSAPVQLEHPSGQGLLGKVPLRPGAPSLGHFLTRRS